MSLVDSFAVGYVVLFLIHFCSFPRCVSLWQWVVKKSWQSTWSTWPRSTSSSTIFSSMVWTYERCRMTLPEHAKTSDPTILVNYSVGTFYDGTHVDTTNPSNQLGISAVSTYSTQHSSTTYSAIITSSRPTLSTLPTDTTLLTCNTINLSVSARLHRHSTIGPRIKARQERHQQELWLWSQPTLKRVPRSLWQPEDQWPHFSQGHPSISLHAKVGHWRMWSSCFWLCTRIRVRLPCSVSRRPPHNSLTHNFLTHNSLTHNLLTHKLLTLTLARNCHCKFCCGMHLSCITINIPNNTWQEWVGEETRQSIIKLPVLKLNEADPSSFQFRKGCWNKS